MKRALLVIDVQNEYFTGKLPVTYPENSFENIIKVIDFANENKIPVLLIQHTNPEKDAATFKKGTDGHKIHEEVMKREYDKIIEKNLPGSFTGTELGLWLKENNIDTLVISGYMTQMCCDTTARHAMHLGFNVEFLSDATGTLDISNYAGEISAEELHKAILITQATRFSEVMSADEWIKTAVNYK
ncbi:MULTISPECIES: cysteine hydrolase family protein [Methanobacterium]|uniref:Cysteine hydrolase family protein n=1 Tax=Methanobacterium veterum TaxID=408577 RepID=A0A9E4ZWW8_9EURY|nr:MULTISPECIES: cysteine hydrolase family protein [Methanobacterium]MCZ3366736.1 cysteine hydrolase family protein [Methanobacterium veterum]MCZ3374118.1 cysteine hydrolase family protein [Methanobacterium veterum]